MAGVSAPGGTHACFRARQDADRQARCDTRYLAEEAVRRAISHRYPDAARSGSKDPHTGYLPSRQLRSPQAGHRQQ